MKTFPNAQSTPTFKVISQLLPQEATMILRTRQVVRMLATFRHAAHCRVVRAAKSQEALRLAQEEAEEKERLALASGDTPPERRH
jgi:precorrin-6B methylase 1